LYIKKTIYVNKLGLETNVQTVHQLLLMSLFLLNFQFLPREIGNAKKTLLKAGGRLTWAFLLFFPQCGLDKVRVSRMPGDVRVSK